MDADGGPLPVTVESCNDETVEITDPSRILAVDLYGMLAENRRTGEQENRRSSRAADIDA